jgi:hypothetical protein
MGIAASTVKFIKVARAKISRIIDRRGRLSHYS